MNDINDKDSLRNYQLNKLEDPYPKRVKINPTKPRKIRAFFLRGWHSFLSFFINEWAAIKELVREIL